MNVGLGHEVGLGVELDERPAGVGDQPAEAVRSEPRSRGLPAPLMRSTSIALSKSPSASSSAFLESIIPAPVASRSFLTSAAVIVMSVVIRLFRVGGSSSSGRLLAVPAGRGRRPRTRSSCGRPRRLGARLGRGAARQHRRARRPRRGGLGRRPRRLRPQRQPRPGFGRRRSAARRRAGRLGGARRPRGGTGARRRRVASAARHLGRRWTAAWSASPPSSSRSHSASGSSAPSSSPAPVAALDAGAGDQPLGDGVGDDAGQQVDGADRVVVARDREVDQVGVAVGVQDRR